MGLTDYITGLWVWADPATGCWRVRLDYQANLAHHIESEMERVYKAIYGDSQLGTQVCNIEVNAFGEVSNDYGQRSEVLLYSTRLPGEQAARVNWRWSGLSGARTGAP